METGIAIRRHLREPLLSGEMAQAGTRATYRLHAERKKVQPDLLVDVPQRRRSDSDRNLSGRIGLREPASLELAKAIFQPGNARTLRRCSSVSPSTSLRFVRPSAHGCATVAQAVQGYRPKGSEAQLVRLIAAVIAQIAAMLAGSKISDFISALNPYRGPPCSAAIAGRVLRSKQLSQHGKQAEWIQAEVAVARNASAAVQMRQVKQEEGAHGSLRGYLKNVQ